MAQTTEEKALALVKAVGAERQRSFYTRTINRRVDTDEALCRVIEQHEAYKRRVSDILFEYFMPYEIPLVFHEFIIPKPDPLVDVLLEIQISSDLQESQHDAIEIRKALDALGFEIREKNYGNTDGSRSGEQPTQSDALREALEDLLHAVCGEKGFAECVRRDSGRIYPWPALDLAEAKAIAALERSK